MRKSRLWTAFSAVVGLAALVVLAGCQGVAGPAGAPGTPGTPGTGTPGPAGTTGNLSPVATAIPTVYLALNGTATAESKGLTPTASFKAMIVTLAKHFKDAESATLTYKAVSAHPAIAMVPKTSTGPLKITGVKAGTTTITVTAFDGVNAGVEATIDVIVVASNSPPSAGVIQPILDLTGPRKLVSNSPLTIAFTAAISLGASGEPTEKIAKFRTFVGTGATAETKLVKAEVTAVSGNSYSLMVTRLKPGTADESGMQKITIFAQDSFGAETMIDLNGDDPTSPMMGLEDSSLIAEVNAPPRVLQPLRDVVLYRLGQGNLGDASDAAHTDKQKSIVFNIADFFAVEYDTDADTADGDTTCVFTTDPKQPTGLVALAAVPAADGVAAVAARVVSPITAATLASVVPNGANVTDRADAELDTLTVNSVPAVTTPVTGTVPASVPAAGLGDFDLTITCSDTEMSVTDTATISVLPDGSTQ